MMKSPGAPKVIVPSIPVETCEEEEGKRPHLRGSVRRLALWNTLIFLGIALSHQKIYTDASHSVGNDILESNEILDPPNDIIDSANQIIESADAIIESSDQIIDTIEGIIVSPREERVDSNDLSIAEEPVERLSNSRFESSLPSVEDESMQPRYGSNEILIVSTADGTLAGIRQATGELLWKQPGVGSNEKEVDHGMKLRPENDAELKEVGRLLRPLVSTTTTKKISHESRTKAVPSLDGTVFLTLSGKETDTGSDVDASVAATAEELVAKAPFVDSRSRFYVGSRHATATAIDGDTGEIIHVVSADSDEPRTNYPCLEGRNIVWMGRVDYSVSVYDARTGAKDVQFSTSEIMSVDDMLEGSRLFQTRNKGAAFIRQKPQAQKLLPDSVLSTPADEDILNAHITPPKTSALVTTPSGNLAYKNPESGHIEWVLNENFDTPVAFAMESSSGVSLGVDVIPDAPIPGGSAEYLSKELERLMEITMNTEADNGDEPALVGTLSNGQLFALPLGKKRTSTTNALITTADTQQHPSVSSALAILGNPKQRRMKVPLIGTRQHSGLHHDGKHGHGPSDPSCLFCKQRSKRDLLPSSAREDTDSTEDHALTLKHRPDFGFPPNGFGQHGNDFIPGHEEYKRIQNQRKNKRILRILGSWLPPTIALFFVLSFEMGRRKRQRDNNSSQVLRSESSELKGDGQDVADSGVIQVTDEVLGYGGHGTVVYKGTLEGRRVAVKRMLKAYHASADREIKLLIESDGHPNVVRYFLKEFRGDFVYLALELCDLSLHDFIVTLHNIHVEGRGGFRLADYCVSEPTKKIILQIALGVKHLHSLRIVHRDLKPANILLAITKQSTAAGNDQQSIDLVYDTFNQGDYVPKISDMGLGKQLMGQSSFGVSTLAETSSRGMVNNSNVVGVGPGSVGWQAPEVMAIRWTSDASVKSENSNGGHESCSDASPLDCATSRTSRSVDIFSLGCIFYSTLVPGTHPFGEWYEREANIMHNRPCIDTLKELSVDAYDLVSAMIQRNPNLRPTAKQICDHPFFWTPHKRLTFLCDLSDRLENDAMIIADPNQTNSASQSAFVTNPLAIESNAAQVVGTSWDNVLYDDLINNVQRFRSYDPSSVRDLLRLLRNKHHHYDELPSDVRARIGTNTDGLMSYFDSKFPKLLHHCYKRCRLLLSQDDTLMMKYCITSESKIFQIKRVRSRNSSTSSNGVTSQVATTKGDEQESLEPDVDGKPESNTVDVLPDSSCPNDVAIEDDNQGAAEEEGSKCEVVSEDLTPHIPESELDATKASSLTSDEDALPSLRDEDKTEVSPSIVTSDASDIIIWEGSTAAKTFNCRGWIRSDEEWIRRPSSKKKNANLVRCADDGKFRTRLCNHWDESQGTFCPMRKKNKCVFAHGPVELRVKDGKRNRWGKLVDKNGNNSNPKHSGGEDTYGAARSIESVRKEEGKWNTGGKNGKNQQGKNQRSKKTFNKNKKKS